MYLINFTNAPKSHLGSSCTETVGLDLVTWLQGLKLTRVQELQQGIEIISKWFYRIKFTFNTVYFIIRKQHFCFFVCTGFKKEARYNYNPLKYVRWGAHMAGHMSHLQNLTYDLFIMG